VKRSAGSAIWASQLNKKGRADMALLLLVAYLQRAPGLQVVTRLLKH
jgi:hypothetical protein